MITLKKEVQAALSSACGNLIYGYPRYFEALPLVAWRESLNRRHAQADGREYLAELNYTLEIFAPDSEAANELLAASDAALIQMGMRRENAAEQFESDVSLSHITARYRCLVDEQGSITQ